MSLVPRHLIAAIHFATGSAAILAAIIAARPESVVLLAVGLFYIALAGRTAGKGV